MQFILFYCQSWFTEHIYTAFWDVWRYYLRCLRSLELTSSSCSKTFKVWYCCYSMMYWDQQSYFGCFFFRIFPKIKFNYYTITFWTSIVFVIFITVSPKILLFHTFFCFLQDSRYTNLQGVLNTFLILNQSTPSVTDNTLTPNHFLYQQ